jgi:glycosyltransferase involved in cell wall biosynthesis
MVPQNNTNIVYCSFDVFPAPKGAAVHIDVFARALGRAFGPVDLVTLATPPTRPSRAPSPPWQDATAWPGPAPCAVARQDGLRATRPWLVPPACSELAPGVRHHGLRVSGGDLVARVLAFRTALAAWWGERRARVAHVRGIYEGFPIAQRKAELCEALVLEANGLPSIELKAHYPEVADDRELLLKLERQERLLATAADLVVTPSRVTARELERRGVPAARIEIIPNGVNEELFAYREPPSFHGRPLRLLYVGTVTRWQGVHHALEALRLLRRDVPAELCIVGAMRRREQRWLLDLAAELDVAPFVQLLDARPQAELLGLYHRADVALVPLVPDDRNLVQGCCPLKLLEAMATGVPVVASALEVVTDLARPDQEIVAVRPGSAKAIKDGVLRLLGDDALGPRLARAARARVEAEHSWRRAGARLVHCYQQHLGLAPPTAPMLAEGADIR